MILASSILGKARATVDDKLVCTMKTMTPARQKLNNLHNAVHVGQEHVHVYLSSAWKALLYERIPSPSDCVQVYTCTCIAFDTFLCKALVLQNAAYRHSSNYEWLF